MVRHYSRGQDNSSKVIVDYPPTPNWRQMALDLFRHSRPFTKEEAKIHANIVDSMSVVIDEKVLLDSSRFIMLMRKMKDGN